MRYLEISVGLGYTLGPIIGSVLFENISYSGTMYTFAFLTVMNAILCYFMMPDIINKEIEEV